MRTPRKGTLDDQLDLIQLGLAQNVGYPPAWFLVRELARKKAGFNSPTDPHRLGGLAPQGPAGMFRKGYRLDPGFEDVTYKAALEGGRPVLSITGAIRNRYKTALGRATIQAGSGASATIKTTDGNTAYSLTLRGSDAASGNSDGGDGHHYQRHIWRDVCRGQRSDEPRL